MSRQFTREEFYELVWSKPITHLAKEFAISDVALHKICRKHDIPNPPLGWWAKKAAGQKVARTPLPRAKAGTATSVTIAAGELRQEPDTITAARDSARILASSIAYEAEPSSNPIVERTASRLRKLKPSGPAGLVSVQGPNLIKCELAPASIDRFELALNRIAVAAEAMDIKLVRGEAAAALLCDGETINFSISEATRREKHIATDEEKAEREAWERKRAKRWQLNSWDGVGSSFLGPRIPEWDYVPTGQLAFEFEQSYFLSGSPRRSFRDAKTQRIEKMTGDILVGAAVLAAAKRQDRLRREEEAQLREQERLRRERVLRSKHVDERRGAILDIVLEELAALERLRQLVANLRQEVEAGRGDRVSTFLAFAGERLETREASLSGAGLNERFEELRLFGSDDDYGFQLPHYY